MNAVIFNPLEDYEKKLKAEHLANTEAYFQALVEKSKVNIAENRATVQQYHFYLENLKKLKRKLNWLRFFRVLMCITIILIPLVILKMTPKIRGMREEISTADQKAQELFDLASKQMQPLNDLFRKQDALELIEKTVPLLKFDPCFTVEQELDMVTNYDFRYHEDEQTTLETLAGRYNDNPFLFENKRIHTMGTETYHGYKTIHWTEHYRGSDGKMQTRHRSETLHATVTEPAPFYSTQVVLNYGAQGGPELSFSRDVTHLEQKSEKEIERYVKKGEKRLKKKTDKALRNNDDFVSMSNTDFEVLFDALDRTDEVQFRTVFTPLAQTNMVDLILSKTGYGDDFNFYKRNRMNKIISHHSQGRKMVLKREDYVSYSFDEIQKNFVEGNAEYFRAVYFDFAPLLAIPMYQERPAHSLKPIPDYNQLYSQKEGEVLANAANSKHFVHPDTKTKAILKTEFVRSENDQDEICVTAYSYDILDRLTYVSVHGGDGHFHDVPVEWKEYIPLEQKGNFLITGADNAPEGGLAYKHGLCILKST